MQLEPLVLAQAVQQAPLAFKGLLGSQEHRVQQALKERRALPAPPALTEPRGLPASLAPLAFRAQQAQEPQALRELQARVLRGLPAQLEFKGQLERPVCPVPLELRGQEQLVPRALQEPG